MKRSLSWVILIILFNRCAFNSVFFQPSKIPANAKKITLRTASDSMVVHFNEQHQPLIKRLGKDTASVDYTIESVVFNSTSGNKLNGWLIKPKSKKVLATLLHLHGNGGNLLSQFLAITPMVTYGFQVFMFDYSGYGFSEGKPTRQVVLNDALSALDYIKSLPDIAGTKVVIYGQSMGGHLAAVVGEKRQNEIDGLVLEAAFSSYKDIGAHYLPILGRLIVKEGYSAKKSIQRYHKPLLIIHSQEDKVVPFYMGKRLDMAANKPKEFYPINKCHICGPDFYADSISVKIKQMLDSAKEN
jgi:dipeptidyl aminopeptidase/acylaminoacyl peptidase